MVLGFVDRLKAPYSSLAEDQRHDRPMVALQKLLKHLIGYLISAENKAFSLENETATAKDEKIKSCTVAVLLS